MATRETRLLSMNDANRPALGPSLVHLCRMDGTPCGIGFLVDQRRLLTCTHVVTAADEKQQQVKLKFPYLNHAVMTATVLSCLPVKDPDGNSAVAKYDIAVLQLDDSAPEGSRPVCLFTGRMEEDHPCWVHGIPTEAETGEQWTSARFTPQQANGWRGMVPDNLKKPIIRGYSGSPVTTATGEAKNLVLGMITTFGKNSSEAFMIPAAVLQEVADLSRVVPHWRPHLQGADPCVLEQYVRWALEQHGTLELIGLGGGDLPLSLEQVYVPLRMECRDGGMEKGREACRSGDVELPEIFALARGRPVTLIGQPGAGKTTALRKLLHICLIQGTQSLKLPPETLPVFLRLRRFDDALLDQPMEVFITRELVEMGKDRLPDDMGKQLWARGKLLLLLDGLDEIALESRRLRVAEKLRRELFDRPRSDIHVVVSSRNAGFAPVAEPFRQTLFLEVKPLNPEQVKEFVDLWFQAAYAKWEKGLPAQARESGEKLLEGLNRQENATQRILGLTGSPLLLALLCLVVVQGGEIPRRRVDFYEECLKVLLHRWGEKQKSESPLLDLESTRSVLQVVAWNLHQAGRRDNMTELEFVLWAEKRLRELGYPDVYGDDLLRWLHQRTGVITGYAEGEYGFMHLGFQEYLAARHVAVLKGSLLEELCQQADLQRDGDSWWKEVILLLAGMAERGLFAEMAALLLKGVEQPQQVELLRGCLEDAKEPDLTPFARLLDPQFPAPVLHAVLRIVKGDKWKKVADLRKQVETLRQSTTDQSVKDLCGQFLDDSSVRMEKKFHLLLVHDARAESVVREWRLHLKNLDLNLWPATQPWRDQVLQVRRSIDWVAVFVGKSPLPWEDDTAQAYLALFNKICLITLPDAPTPLVTPWDSSPLSVATPEDLANLVLGKSVVTAAAMVLPGQAFIEPRTGLRLLWVPGGSFTMGCNTSDQSDERPEHEVRLSGYWLAETPVTNRQYGIYLQSTSNVEEPAYWRDRRFSDPEQPVVGVSWEEARAFCRWLSEGADQPFTLPSEAQWEYAARGVDGREFPWGNDPLTDQHACFGQDWNTGRPAPVGSYPAGRGPFGHLDLLGNVWEWVSDWYDGKYYANSPPDDPQGPSKGSLRVERGGSWDNGPANVRSADRNCSDPGVRYDDLGFRLSRTCP
ncbi:MAG: SUMF1/EgtB/PvdO family nonheme iron enzyme [Magnetococcales bacterium]|nr:SUMF1/EgtB/PvdO family nonheme iron enzyme [Magnetococcales bacterium]